MPAASKHTAQKLEEKRRKDREYARKRRKENPEAARSARRRYAARKRGLDVPKLKRVRKYQPVKLKGIYEEARQYILDKRNIKPC